MPDIHLEECIAGLEGSYDLRSETHRGFDGVKAEMIRLNDRMETMFRWTMSLILINWLSLLAGIFLFALKK